MDFKNYQTPGEFAREAAVAVQFDLRDNPRARDLANALAVTQGKAGKRLFVKLVEEDLKRDYGKDPRPPLFPWTRAAFRTYTEGAGVHAKFGLGQWGALIGGALQAVGSAAASIYSSKVASTTQLKIAKLQQAQTAADAQAAAQIAAAQAKAAQEGAIDQTTGVPRVAGASMFGGMSLTTVLPIVLIAGVGIFFLAKKL